MNKLISYTIKSVDFDKKVVVFDAEFTKPEWNKTKKMHYKINIIEAPMTKVERERDMRLYGKAPEIAPDSEDEIKNAIVAWASSYVVAREKEEMVSLSLEKARKDTEGFINKKVVL